MKGQLSLEYLLLFLVALALIAVSLSALSEIRKGSMAAFSKIKFKSNAEKLSSSINEACALGEGNQVSAEITVPLQVRYSEGGISVSSENSSMSFGTECPVEDSSDIYGKVYAVVEDGTVVLEQESR